MVIQEVTKELAESFGLPKAAGALVNSVEKGGPAEKAGIQASDVILKFDNKEVEQLQRAAAPGGGDPARRQGARSQVWRKGERKDLTIAVAETPEERTGKRQQSRKPSGEAVGKLGLAVIELTAEQKRRSTWRAACWWRTPKVRLRAPASGVATSSWAVGNQEIKSADELNRLLAARRAAAHGRAAGQARRGFAVRPVALNGN